jgi:hypothetical protein
MTEGVQLVPKSVPSFIGHLAIHTCETTNQRALENVGDLDRLQRERVAPPSSPPFIRKGSESGQVTKHQSFSNHPAWSAIESTYTRIFKRKIGFWP